MFENKQKKMISRILAHHGFKNKLIKTVEELSSHIMKARQEPKLRMILCTNLIEGADCPWR